MLVRFCLKSYMLGLQHYVNQELPDVQAGFRKGRGTMVQVANIHWIIEKSTEFQKNIYLCFINYGESWTLKKGECQRIDAFKLWC